MSDSGSASSSSSSSSGSDEESVQSASVGEKRKMKEASSTSKSSITLKVEVSPINPEHDPVVVSFPRGVPSSIADQGSNATPPTFSCHKYKESSSRGRRIEGEDDHCTYSAATRGGKYDGKLSKTYVCLFDKKKNTLKLIPSAEQGTVFALDQSVKEYSPAVMNENSTAIGEKDSNISASDRVKMLVDSFGSKKKQKVMDSRAANKVNVHSVVGGGNFVPENVKDSATNVDSQQDSYEQARRALLPPFDANADAPQKVYNAQALMGEAAWNRVSGIVNRRLRDLKDQDGASGEALCESLLGKAHCPQSIRTLMGSIKISATGSPYRFKVTFFLYLIMRFYNKIDRRGFLRGKTVDDCINECHLPHETGVKIFDLFTTPIEGKEDGFLLSKNHKTKLYIYCLILYITASSKDMTVSNISPLCKDLRLDDKKASMILREAGFAVKKNSVGELGVKLSTPLVFPPPRRGKRS